MYLQTHLTSGSRTIEHPGFLHTDLKPDQNSLSAPLVPSVLSGNGTPPRYSESGWCQHSPLPLTRVSLPRPPSPQILPPEESRSLHSGALLGPLPYLPSANPSHVGPSFLKCQVQWGMASLRLSRVPTQVPIAFKISADTSTQHKGPFLSWPSLSSSTFLHIHQLTHQAKGGFWNVSQITTRLSLNMMLSLRNP